MSVIAFMAVGYMIMLKLTKMYAEHLYKQCVLRRLHANL